MVILWTRPRTLFYRNVFVCLFVCLFFVFLFVVLDLVSCKTRRAWTFFPHFFQVVFVFFESYSQAMPCLCCMGVFVSSRSVLRAGVGCVSTCGPGEVNVSGVCRSCGVGCAVCNDAYSCATCAGNMSWFRGACFDRCPFLTYEDVQGQCRSCSFQCMSPLLAPCFDVALMWS
jgi:hypothetical protein